MSAIKILIDIGNSRIKWKIISCKSDALTSSISYQSSNLIDQLESSDMYNTQRKVKNVYISNVAGDEIKIKLFQWIVDKFNVEPEFAISRKEMCGLINAYQHPEMLGVDRFLAMIAGNSLNNYPKVIVDCGTAVTVDSIDSSNKFVGGLIMPGLNLMRLSLSEQTMAIDNVKSNEKFTLFATDTASGISSGSILAITSAIERVVKKLIEQEGSKVECFLTGGDGKLIQSNLGIQAVYMPDMVIKGLSLYFQAK